MQAGCLMLELMSCSRHLPVLCLCLDVCNAIQVCRDDGSQLTTLCSGRLCSTIPQPIPPQPFPNLLNHLTRQPMPHSVLNDHILRAIRADVHIGVHLLPKLGRDEVVVLAAQDQNLFPDIRVDRWIVGPVVHGARVLFFDQLP